ncbi:ABC transporter ABCl1 [Drechmeria coniospora]|uniref:ABC transporter ABCl1 n=1 Tax=Drechmeria coniospora TaxID=98403 RepID=A0A151GBH1_DRECN|nr:ABC transporter ABCl1 [Drechmeria coniospora]KYK54403.1 ABC transporter ABCl1 [Drechmeria coniospora]
MESVTRIEQASNEQIRDRDHAAKNDEPPLQLLHSDDDDEYTPDIQALARSYSQPLEVPSLGQLMAESDSPHNPNSPNFNGRKWAKTAVKLLSQNGTSYRSAGVCFQNLNVHGYGRSTDFQKDIANVWLSVAGFVRRMTKTGSRRVDILRQLDGLLHKGEMLVVLGPPGSGCSTFLKTIAGEKGTHHVSDGSYMNYQGIPATEMRSRHRGEAVYSAEEDVHFPQLSVGDTLYFAARARQPRHLPVGVSESQLATYLRDVAMAVFGISHTANTCVGSQLIRGVSGGERKRVTIAEAALSGAPLQCWDNSTRGLDSANAIDFCRTLRLQADVFSATACVSMYQAPQDAYDLFDKVLVLYEGRQIFFGRADAAAKYFHDLGFHCPERQSTPDFLTSMTSPPERVVRPGFAGKVPRTSDDFAAAWRRSQEYATLQLQLEEYKKTHPLGGHDAEVFRASKQAQQAQGQRNESPFMRSYWSQVTFCLWRGWKRLVCDPSTPIGAIIGNFILALIIGSVFYNLDSTSSSFFARGALLFFALLMNAFASSLDILTLYAQRPIVEKHNRYALYHPSAEAISSLLCDLPYKIMNSIIFNSTIYFLANLRREPGAFFFFLLVTFSAVLVMSMIFRTIASASRTLSQALVPASILMLDLVIFTGFVLPKQYMLGWCRWLSYINPLAYTFEALMVNEFHNRQFTCTDFIPTSQAPSEGLSGALAKYANVANSNRVCSAIGAIQGQDFVSGDAYTNSQFDYEWGHRWRNFGILIGFTVLFLISYLVAAEYVPAEMAQGEILVYRRGHRPTSAKHADKESDDAEHATTETKPVVSPGGGEKGEGVLQQQTTVFHWHDVCYDIPMKPEPRRILDRVDGWVKPGTLTALMGVSGAGKTTLLDCLAGRASIGMLTGDMFVDGRPRDMSFQRKTGYVQQADLHLHTATVREALAFSALLRQPAEIADSEKLAYVEEVIKMLDMEEYSDAVVGVPGEGLNIEQRKRLTIAVELAAKPPLLLFVDEPTSGLDSQTSWVILDLLEKLAKSGQAVLCTIHQPSAMLFQRFDRLLLLAEGGKSIYFGEIGEGSRTMTGYFEKHAGYGCPADANPAEWMLQVTRTTTSEDGDGSGADWVRTWRESDEFVAVQEELDRLKREPQRRAAGRPLGDEDGPGSNGEFAAPFTVQLKQSLVRIFQQYWRTPVYIYSKLALCTLTSLFIGFIFFQAPNTVQGLQNQMFAIFQLLTVLGQIVQQSMPQFMIQRSLYEARERPSKVYSWVVFMLSQIIVELPWNGLMSVVMYFCWYYPVGLHRNAEAAGETSERGALMFLFILMFMLFTSTFSTFVTAGFESAEGAANLASLMITLSLIFCGVLVQSANLPRFWVFLNRVSPFTYLVGGMLSTGVANTEVVCAANELLHFSPPAEQTCGEYMSSYVEIFGGRVMDASATATCAFCPIADTNTFLARVDSRYSERWRNLGILSAYVVFNIAAAMLVYWLARVPKRSSRGAQAKS